jgi:NADH:ubiquinone oxidoreductase subunit K
VVVAAETLVDLLADQVAVDQVLQVQERLVRQDKEMLAVMEIMVVLIQAAEVAVVLALLALHQVTRQEVMAVQVQVVLFQVRL